MQINLIEIKALTGIIAWMPQKNHILELNSWKQSFSPFSLEIIWSQQRSAPCCLSHRPLCKHWYPWILLFWSPGGLQGRVQGLSSCQALPGCTRWNLRLSAARGGSQEQAALHNLCSVWPSELGRQSFQNKLNLPQDFQVSLQAVSKLFHW